MSQSLPIRRSPALFVRRLLYVLRGGFLVRPMVIAILLGLLGAVFSAMEERYPMLSAWVPSVLFPSRSDPQVAQVILAGIAASIMTVVSIVFAILLMTLTLASMQFSPRILIRWVSRYAPDVALSDPPHVLRVIMPAIELEGLLDTAFEQIRHYSMADVAVSARLLRALDDIAASTSDTAVRNSLAARARRVYAGCRTRLEEQDLTLLRRRLTELEARPGVSHPAPSITASAAGE